MTGLSETRSQAGPLEFSPECSRTASAGSRNVCAEVLKSAVCGSSTVKYKSGFTKRRMLFDSMMVFGVEARILRMRGMASARRPCWVRTHQERSAPATKKLEVSDSPERSFSSDTAQE